MLFDIRATLEAEYDPPAGAGRHVVRLMPATIPGVQRRVSGLVRFDPVPVERRDHVDFWGNAVIEAVWRGDHARLATQLLARVDRPTREPALDLSARQDRLAADIAAVRDLGPEAPHHFVAPSPRVPVSAPIGDWARTVRSGAKGDTTLALLLALGRDLNRQMRFDPGATTVETAPEEAFLARHGVCQDYAHVLIAGLRAVGVPAGYVSGFLRTLPPPGHPRLEGADAMHAWVRAWTGSDMGWVEYDPTNDVLVGLDHVRVAVGRDYGDVSPVRGVLRHAGRQLVRQMVDVLQVA